MPSIRDRGEGNAKRKDRLAKLKKGPGVFIYNGKAFHVESIPTPLRSGHDEPVFDASGSPVLDSSGQQVFEKPGKIITDDKGNPRLGGKPKIVKSRLEVFDVRGTKFPEGEPVAVGDHQLALKLRGMDCFEEVEPGEEIEPVEAPKKRGRPAKAKPEAEDVEG